METQWINVLMTANIRGAILGRYSMQFEAGKTYKIDEGLFEVFRKIDCAALSGDPQNLNVLHVDQHGISSWGSEKND